MAWKKYFLEEMEYEETGNSQFKKKKKKNRGKTRFENSQEVKRQQGSVLQAPVKE